MKPQEQLKRSYRYLNLLRNKPKRVYGFTYLAWLRAGCVGETPAKPKGLSFMGAQAVRLQLHDFLDNKPLSIAGLSDGELT